MSSDGRDKETDRPGVRRRLDVGQVGVSLAVVAVVAIIILSLVRVPESAVAVSAQLNALIALTRSDVVTVEDIVVKGINIENGTVLTSSGDLRGLVPGYEGQIAVDRGPAMVTLSSLAIPHDWLVSIESDGEDGALRINAQPAKGSAAASRATLSLVLPRGTKLGLVPPGGSEIRTIADQTTSTIITSRIIDLSIQLDRKEAEVFGSLAVRTISLQQMRRRFDMETGQERAEFGGSVRQGSLWIDADRESPRALTPIDRLRLGGLRDAVMNVRVDGGVMDIVLRGRAAEISNSQGDRAIDLRPDRLTVLAQSDLLKILLALLAFLAGLEITWLRRR